MEIKRGDELPPEKPAKDGPLTQLVDERDRNSLDNVAPVNESPATSDAQKTGPNEYAEGTTEHDDDREP